MDILSIGGLILGFCSLLTAFIIEKGNPAKLLQISAALIVFGGTTAAVLVSFPMSEIKLAIKHLKMVFMDKKIDFAGIVEQLVQLSDRARKEGLLALEQEIPNIQNPLLKKGLGLVVDGIEGEVIRDILDREVYLAENELKSAAEVFEAAGGYAPTMGIIGTVMGLISVLGNISNPDELGPAIAVAFVATLYGVSSANLIWLNFGKKIKTKAKQERMLNEIIVEGLLSIQAGENPRILREKIGGMIHEGGQKEKQATEAASATVGG
ncbi:flagellar motor protein [Caldicellulosiruptor naganoensis]|uniref:Flagellar motor protein n=1 Tax=Caldicellulosiruptor naganoensis TaxID=29324 RepID=A0ABY7BGF5_9FIRM|nr:flagellar motor protein [Caldicellulosiruptor naganoensis]WAM30962.1 flagellar motor protein [Caldicellulosiruptor naganoensis]